MTRTKSILHVVVIVLLLLVGPLTTVPISNCLAEELATGGAGNLTFELRPLASPEVAAPAAGGSTGSGSIGVELTISSQSGNLPEPTVTTLANPVRVVIDFSGVKVDSRTVKLDRFGVVAVRFGRHPDHARVVLDFAQNAEVAVKVTKQDNPKERTVIISHGKGASSVAASLSPASLNPVSLSPASLNPVSLSPVSLGPLSSSPVTSVNASSAASAALSSAGLSSAALSSAGSSNAISAGAMSAGSGSSSSERVVTELTPVTPEILSVKKEENKKERVKTEEVKKEQRSVPLGEEFTAESSASVSSYSSLQAAGGRVVSTLPVRPQNTSEAQSSSSQFSSLELPRTSSVSVSSMSSAGEINGEGVISTIGFQKNDRGLGLVVIEVSNLSHYSVTRAQDNVFEVVIDNAHLAGGYLELPQFPPDFFEGLEVVRAKNRGRNVVIELFVEESIKVTPYASRGQLNIGLGY